MAIIIPIESIDLKRLRRRALQSQQIGGRRRALTTQGFDFDEDFQVPDEPLPPISREQRERAELARRQAGPPDPGSLFGTRGIEAPVSPTAVPSPTPTRVSPQPVTRAFDRPTPPQVSPVVQQALESAQIVTSTAKIEQPLPPRTPKEMLEDIDKVLTQQLELRRQGSAFDADLVNALVEQRREINRGRPGRDLIEAIDILSAIYGGTLIDSFNKIKAGDFGIGLGDFENPLDIAERQQARSGLARIASEALTPLEGLVIARSIPALVKLAGTVAREAPRVVSQGVVRASDAPLIRLTKITKAEAAPLPPPELPPGQPERITVALDQAEAFRSIDSPGFTGGFLDKIPGVSHIQNVLRPANKLPPKIQNAWVASGGEKAAFLTDQFPSRSRIFQQIDDLFGARVVDQSGKTVPGRSPVEGGRTGVRFTGPESERVGIEGTILDIAQRPQFYDLTPEMKTFLLEWQTRQSGFQQQLIQGYGARVGEFTVPEGSVFLSNVDVGTEMLTVMRQTEEQAIRQGRGATRVFETAADRMKANPDFNPVVDIRKLQSGMDEWRATVAGNEVFKQGIGGKTLVEVISEKHPDLLKIKLSLTRRITNLKSQLDTAERQATTAGSEINRISTRLDNTTKKAQPLLDRVESLELLREKGWGPELSFLSGQVRELLLQAANLERRGISLTERATGAMARRGLMLDELDQLAPQLDTVRRRYNAADLRPFQFVQEAVFRYFPADEARAVRELSKFSTSHWVSFLDNVRGTVLSADASPMVGVQLPLHLLFQPHRAIPRLVGAGKNSIQSRDLLNVFRESTMAKVVEANPQLARDFAFFTGLPVQTGTITEFSGGFLRLINPTILGKRITFGEKFQVFNERMFSVALRQSFDTFDDITQRLARSGVVGDDAKVIAADMATKVIPVWNPARLGLSQSRAAAIRALPTSISFIIRPAALITEATTGFAKIALKQTLTPQEKMAVQLMTTLSGSVMMLSMTSAAISALSRGNDPIQAIKDAINPNSATFADIIIGDRRVPLGGPYRGIFKLIWPREVDWAPVPVPFANIVNFALTRTNPFISTQIRQLQNRDFFGGEIRKGEVPERVLRGLLFEIEGFLPLTGSATISGIRRGLDPGEIGEEVGAQALGVNIGQETPFQQRDLAVQRWAKSQGIERGQVFQLNIEGEDIEVDQSQKIDSFYDLVPSDRQRFDRENPSIVEEIKKETKRRADQGIEFAVKRQDVEDLEQESLKFQLADDDLLNSRKISPTEWRSRRKERRKEFNNKREVVYSDLDPRDPETVMDYYYAQFDKIEERFGGQMTDDAWEELESWVASQPQNVQEYIDENTGLSALTLKEQEYKDDLELLRGYWDLPDIVVAMQDSEKQKVYTALQELFPADQVRWTTSNTPGDSQVVRDKKEENRRISIEINKAIEDRLEKARLNSSAIRGVLLKWEFKFTKQLINIAAAEELIGATP